ncbi:Predicted PurR-regulated permease PerM [Marinitoga hydrogenitolerans DSM 16785]|uniref:Predicted PurR-regulated permease PerM n=1 Tax=Marinitoga hydrogenitolerans (strain DSM 16785 / JCM 12826 / AT1271) TaxID=1122195 RepID=A0A1M5A8L0_MARH1|nr:AI-2E family transporter [Marinitoga hydrogenitolerans]SHF26681.1 Predicted PurR-regulated permease PerM [Marinitoga hydrogenitolerans DSM 16785]
MPKSFWFIIFYFTLFLILLKIFPTIIGSLVVALFFTLLIDVIASYLEKLKISRKITVPLASLIFYGAIVYSLYSLIPITIEEGKKAFDVVNSIEINQIPGKTGEVLNTLLDTAGKYLNDLIIQFASYLASNISNFITVGLLLIVASAYMAIVNKQLWNAIDKFFPNSEIKTTKKFLLLTIKDLKKFVSGQIITAFFVGLTTWFSALVMGFPYPLFLGILSGITDFIPYLGVFITAIPITLLGFTNFGLVGILKALLILTIANQLEMWILSPRISGGKVHLNWFLVLVSLLIFGQLYGIVGVLITIPILIIIRNVWDMYIIQYLKKI